MSAAGTPIPGGALELPPFSLDVQALDLALSTDELAAIEAAVPADAVAGERYEAAQLTMLDSER